LAAFSIFGGNNMLSNVKKASWLQSHYRDYSKRWYLADESRLNAIFNREYKTWLDEETAAIEEEQQAHIDKQASRMQAVYRAVYGVDFESDSRTSRFNACKRAQAIRDLWVPDIMVE
jgi:hypothetical protein